jgi:hypothetical protein
MMCSFKKMVLLGLVLVCLVMMGCASSQLVESWQEPTFEDKPLGKILVLGVFQEDESRRLYEDAVVKALEKGKGSAIAGYTLMPKVEDYDEEEDIMAAVAKVNADAVMIATLVDFEQKENYRAPQAAYVPTIGLGHGLYNSYSISYDRVYDDGHTVVETTVKLEITVFSAKTKQMVWAGATKSVDPKSGKGLVNDVSDLIVEDMKNAGFL